MRWVAMLGVVWGAVVLAGCGDPIFGCTEQSQCGDAGTCQPTGYCSFSDPDCDSGERYGELAAPGLAGNCVPEEQASGTGDEAPMTEADASGSGSGSPSASGTASAGATGDTDPVPGETDADATGMPMGPDPYGACPENTCEYVTAACVHNGPFSMCSPPCSSVAEPSDECPSSPYAGQTVACLYTDEAQTSQSCFVTCNDGMVCPGDSVCTGKVCSFDGD